MFILKSPNYLNRSLTSAFLSKGLFVDKLKLYRKLSNLNKSHSIQHQQGFNSGVAVYHLRYVEGRGEGAAIAYPAP